MQINKFIEKILENLNEIKCWVSVNPKVEIAILAPGLSSHIPPLLLFA
jgi:hypothetical protein